MRLASLLFVGLILFAACSGKSADSLASKRAREVWKRNERAVEHVINGEAELDEDFMEAWRFFRDTIGIVIRLDGDYVGLRLTADSEDDLDLIQDWYRDNKHRLYWDESSGFVGVKAPQGPAGDIWWRHESVLLDLIAGEDLTESQKNNTQVFFLELTGVDIFASQSERRGLIPPRGPQRLLPRLRDWYERNGQRLFVDYPSGRVKLNPKGVPPALPGWQ